MATKFIVMIALAALCATASSTRITLNIRELPSKDPNDGAPDTFVNVYYATSATAPYQLLGRTKYQLNNKNPDFPEVFDVPDSGDATQALKFDIYDADSPDEGDDYIGYVWTRVNDVFKAKDGVFKKWIDGTSNGYLYVKVQ